MRGPGRSEDWRRPGSGSGSGSGLEMPVRRVGVVESVIEGIETTVCGRLAQIQLVHACAGIPVPLSKVPGQVPSAFNFVCGALEQGDQQFPVLSTDGGRACNEP
jgi:hypothetical protein